MDVRSAALDMESASLELAISRNELLPQLNAIAGGYLAGLTARAICSDRLAISSLWRDQV